MSDNRFNHLPLPLIAEGKPFIRGMGNSDQRTEENKANRISHGTNIKRKATEISRFWQDRQQERKAKGLPDVNTGIPLLLEIDPNTDLKFLKSLGFEIISEMDNGYVIVSNDDVSFSQLFKKTDDFIAEVSSRCNTPARIYTFLDDTQRFDKIFGNRLKEAIKTIEDDTFYYFDVSISCSGNIFELEREPVISDYQDTEQFNANHDKWEKNYYEAYQKWDDLCYERQTEFETFIGNYGGTVEIGYLQDQGNFVRFPDSFSTRIRIPGKCLKDLLYNYSPIFSIELVGNIILPHYDISLGDNEADLEIVPPDDDAPAVVVIDSGIEEEHKLIEPAILKDDSLCVVKDSKSVSDEVENGGHGTRVAGAILYPRGVTSNGIYKLPCFIQNMRVLNKENTISYKEDVFPPFVISLAVNKYHITSQKHTKIFNHSISDVYPCGLIHMASWATAIDDQSYENDVLFIQSSGNISANSIQQYFEEGKSYPQYLYENDSRIANPAQSVGALTVGSIALNSFDTEDESSIASYNEPSSFTRIGAGIWDSIKPDVVEYGGDWVKSKHDSRLSLKSEVCPDLVRTSPEGPSHSKDDIGTSFSAPKVAYIAAQIQKLYPNAPALLYRALIAQSAEQPTSMNDKFANMCDITRCVGYGIPNLERAISNDEYRITFITEKEYRIFESQTHIFRIPIPKELNEIGENYSLKISVTLSYMAKPRSTRRTLKRYLSTWLDWRCSKKGESIDSFKERILYTDASVNDDGNFKWAIGEKSNSGQSKDFSRSNSTLQKDWAIINSNELTEDFCVAVRAHKGWNANIPAKYTLVVTFEALDADIEIYEPIRNLIETETEIIAEQQIEIKDETI